MKNLFHLLFTFLNIKLNDLKLNESDQMVNSMTNASSLNEIHVTTPRGKKSDGSQTKKQNRTATKRNIKMTH